MSAVAAVPRPSHATIGFFGDVVLRNRPLRKLPFSLVRSEYGLLLARGLGLATPVPIFIVSKDKDSKPQATIPKLHGVARGVRTPPRRLEEPHNFKGLRARSPS
jgi:hypothetical protein